MSEITATKEQQNKYEALKEYLRSLGSVAVAFSSGVDSTFLLKTAHDVLGDKCIAITAMSCSFPKRELEEAKAFCEKEGIRHITVESEELEIEGFCQNPANRCYICKKELFEKIWDIARKEGLNAVAEGSNMDDNGDYRPGLQAVAELGVQSSFFWIWDFISYVCVFMVHWHELKYCQMNSRKSWRTATRS